jgi:hypothetical protein
MNKSVSNALVFWTTTRPIPNHHLLQTPLIESLLDFQSDALDQIEKVILLVSLFIYIGLSFWLSRYTSSFKISRNTYLNMELYAKESQKNAQEYININISNFSFLAGALVFKMATVTLLIIHKLGLLSNDNPSYTAAIIFNSTSFVLLLVACSLQLYKWIIIMLRIQYFGGMIDK